MPSDGKSSLCLWQGELKTDIVNTIAIKNNTNVYLLYKDCSFFPDRLTNMAATSNN
jgi:hypothetical protein